MRITQETTPVPMLAIPSYLQVHYAWAYIHPRAVRLFERDWLVNLILWGNYRRLGDLALAALGTERRGLVGRSLQVACVYGDLTSRLLRRVEAGGGSLDVIDVLAVQLANLRRKLPDGASVRLMQENSAHLGAADGSYDRAVLFFLLHEQPRAVRAQTIRETLRVVRPGGRIVMVDFARPRWWHPLRYLWLPVLRRIEPFACDLWQEPAGDWLPRDAPVASVTCQEVFGGMYQVVTIIR